MHEMVKLYAQTPQNGQTHSQQFVGFYQRIIWECLTILLGWSLKG